MVRIVKWLLRVFAFLGLLYGMAVQMGKPLEGLAIALLSVVVLGGLSMVIPSPPARTSPSSSEIADQTSALTVTSPSPVGPPRQKGDSTIQDFALTPALQKIIQAKAQNMRLGYRIARAATVIVAIVMITLITEGIIAKQTDFVLITSFITVISLLVCGIFWAITKTGYDHRLKDMKSGTYIRVTGHFSADTSRDSDPIYYLRYGGRFHQVPMEIYDLVNKSQVHSGTVEATRYAAIVFAVTDDNGTDIYRDPHYWGTPVDARSSIINPRSHPGW